MKQQKQSLAVPNSYNVKPAKPFIPDKYNNNIELKKLKRVNYFTIALLELRSWGFSENEGMESFILNPKYFYGDPIFSHKSAI